MIRAKSQSSRPESALATRVKMNFRVKAQAGQRLLARQLDAAPWRRRWAADVRSGLPHPAHATLGAVYRPPEHAPGALKPRDAFTSARSWMARAISGHVAAVGRGPSSLPRPE